MYCGPNIYIAGWGFTTLHSELGQTVRDGLSSIRDGSRVSEPSPGAPLDPGFVRVSLRPRGGSWAARERRRPLYLARGVSARHNQTRSDMSHDSQVTRHGFAIAGFGADIVSYAVSRMTHYKRYIHSQTVDGCVSR